MKSNYLIVLTVLALFLAACSQTPPRPGTPDASPSKLVTYPAENAEEPVTLPEDALDSTLPAGNTGPMIDVRQYEPMPLPVRSEEPAGETLKPEGEVLGYNLQTGEERHLGALAFETLAAMPDSALTPGSPGVNQKAPEGTLEPLNFGGLSKISDPALWPRSTNVKVFQRFSNGKRYECSGQLYDAKWVITAAHCIFDSVDGGYASEVVVVPGYKNSLNNTDYADDFRDQPFGAARAVWTYAYSDWRNDEDYDHDIAWLELDRPIGILSGWEGFGYTTDCNYFKAPSFYNYSFPGESPYNGQYLYYRSGSFDSCEVNSSGWYGYEVTFNRYSYKGQSGSTFVRGGGILAVLSNGGSSSTDAPRITAGKYNNMVTWRNDKKPDTADLVAMDVNTNRTALSAGETFDLNFLAYNYSDGTYYDWLGHYVYLSTNDVISHSDKGIGYFEYSGPTTINAGQAIRVGPASGYLKAPSCSPNGPGTYYIGVIIYNYNQHGDSDAIETNNRTRYTDTQEVYVSAPKCP